jgi:hypothetical protein
MFHSLPIYNMQIHLKGNDQEYFSLGEKTLGARNTP